MPDLYRMTLVGVWAGHLDRPSKCNKPVAKYTGSKAIKTCYSETEAVVLRTVNSVFRVQQDVSVV